MRQEAAQVIAQTLQEEAQIKLAYDDYVAQNHERFQEVLEAKRQHLGNHKVLGLWDEETITKLAAPAARSEILKGISTDTLESFSVRYKAEQQAARLTRLLLPAPKEQTATGIEAEQGTSAPKNPEDDYITV